MQETDRLLFKNEVLFEVMLAGTLFLSAGMFFRTKMNV